MCPRNLQVEHGTYTRTAFATVALLVVGGADSRLRGVPGHPE